jgi:hypothetical protein
MPWQGVCPMELRMRLVNALVAEEDSMTALCEEYGVSRKTGYTWLTRPPQTPSLRARQVSSPPVTGSPSLKGGQGLGPMPRARPPSARAMRTRHGSLCAIWRVG